MLERPESQYILKRLTEELSPKLHYHSVRHTIDVYEVAKMLAQKEKVGKDDTALLLIAALYHDSGYLYTNIGHEAVSCRIAADHLPVFNYNAVHIEKICAVIAVTELPQQPKSKLEQIICDADLDYLGRDDYFQIAHGLYLELSEAGIITGEDAWHRLQVEFLQKHCYFTDTAKHLRDQKKQENLKLLLSK